jgi:hypothetical protein
LELLHIGSGDEKCSKIFFGNPSRGVKTYGESEFDIFKAKKYSLIQGRPVY